MPLDDPCGDVNSSTICRRWIASVASMLLGGILKPETEVAKRADEIRIASAKSYLSLE